MITSLFDFIEVFCSLGTGIGIYLSYKNSGGKQKQLRDFSFFFLSYAVYQIFRSSYLFTKDLEMVALFYNIAIIFYFFVLMFPLRFSLNLLGYRKGLIDFINGLMWAIGLFVVFWQFKNPQLPILDQEVNFLYFNPNLISAWISSIVGFLVAMVPTIVFAKSFWIYYKKGSQEKKTDPSIQMGKIKGALLVVTSLSFGISSLFTFHNTYFLTTMIAYLTVFIGFVTMGLVLFVVPKHPGEID